MASKPARQMMMRAVQMSGPGGIDVLSIASVPKPKLRRGEVLVKVAATAVNRGDIAQRKGIYPAPPGASEILGLEFAGTVVDQESSLEDMPGYVPENGSRVMGILPGGGYAEYVAVPATLCMPVPDAMPLAVAAALPETYMTAYQAIHIHGGLLADDTHSWRSRPPPDVLGRKYRMLVHAGASGVGVAACHLATLFDIDSITTSSENKVEACKQWATHALSRTPDESESVFRRKVESVAGPNGIDLVIDPVFGGIYMEENAQVLAMDGTVVVLSFLGGTKLQKTNASDYFRKRATIKFSSLRSTSDNYKAGLTASFRRRVLPAFNKGTLKPVVSKTLALDDVKEAHRLLEANEVIGKVVLVVDKATA
jgi:NADPH2:quinone reductase